MALDPPIPGARLRVSAAGVEAAFDRLALAMQPLLKPDPPILLGILLGGLMPLARLASRLESGFDLDTCRVSRYGHATRGGPPQWIARPRVALKDRHVVLVDDIYDAGSTLDFLRTYCQEVGARQVTALVLVSKQHSRRQIGPKPDLVGLEVGDEFVFGCGMDYRGQGREVPEIWGLGGVLCT